jgi:tetratricopeptide (TPR) repeat protein
MVAAMLAAVCVLDAQRLTQQQRAKIGFDALNAGKPAEAAAAFAEALRDGPDDPRILLGAGVAAHQLGHVESARQHLAGALRLDPALTQASLLLGEILYRGNDLNGAIQIYEQALASAPANERLAARLESWRSEAALHDKFSQKLGVHFTVLFEGPPEAELAKKAVEILESAYARIGSALYTYPPDVITVILYTREQFRDVTQSPSWAGGLFDGRIRVPVQNALKNPAALEKVLAHEFTHALVRSIAPRGVPQWLNEGLALNFEGSDQSARVELVRHADKVPALSALEGPFTRMDSQGAEIAYAQSAAAVKILLDEAGASAIVGILTDLANGLPFAEAFVKHAHEPYVDFQSRVRG